ncbi:MAG: hypothetical protein CVV64_01700 [Candidatus Wallbacteria bacterium HGW-Wallbacteria-1]|jgi:cytochrome c2|uniref:Uncharacterized protein n=1 Tax=Candidatus Wallbacteria bacterium HGW-Wallbacteria-1 TaxID=2013854 RepID=A0A2N1PV23_9BACT|nr:MAG: hypothetical protein CVV64_01700 [Candidatus Wallbacteria bacterium HGW-Wallbacteria-1]
MKIVIPKTGRGAIGRRRELLKTMLGAISKGGVYLTVCANCHRVKVNSNRWCSAGPSILELFDLDLSHGLCIRCLKKLYPELYPSPGRKRKL